jgi:hypothetical protein
MPLFLAGGLVASYVINRAIPEDERRSARILMFQIAFCITYCAICFHFGFILIILLAQVIALAIFTYCLTHATLRRDSLAWPMFFVQLGILVLILFTYGNSSLAIFIYN